MVKLKIIESASQYPTATSGAWIRDRSRTAAIYGIVRDGVQIGKIFRAGNSWHIALRRCDNEYRTGYGLLFRTLKEAKAWAVANYEVA